MDNIDISKLDKAKVLCALYNRSRPLGLGFLQYEPEPMGESEAVVWLGQTQRFDYLKGRVMKVNLSGDSFNPALYDRDNGEGAAREAIASLQAEEG